MESDKKNVFLNTLGDMNRQMYHITEPLNPAKESLTNATTIPKTAFDFKPSKITPSKRATPSKIATETPTASSPPPSQRFNTDIILNNGVKEKNQKSDDSRLIASLTEEIKNLKGKMEFVIEKDEEIYRLQCETQLLQKQYATLQQTQVTDESLVRENEALREKHAELMSQNTELAKKNTELSEETTNLKKQILRLHRNKTSCTESDGYMFDIGSIKEKLSSQNIQKVDSVLLATILKYKLSDNQWVTKETMNALMKEIILGCKLATENK